MNSEIIQLRTVFVMANNNIAADNFRDLLDLQVLNGVKVKQYYKRPQIVSEMEECIEQVAAESILDKLQASDFIGLMLDETCDVSVEKKIAIYVRYIDYGEVHVSFIGNEPLLVLKLPLSHFWKGKTFARMTCRKSLVWELTERL